MLEKSKLSFPYFCGTSVSKFINLNETLNQKELLLDIGISSIRASIPLAAKVLATPYHSSQLSSSWAFVPFNMNTQWGHRYHQWKILNIIFIITEKLSRRRSKGISGNYMQGRLHLLYQDEVDFIIRINCITNLQFLSIQALKIMLPLEISNDIRI